MKKSIPLSKGHSRRGAALYGMVMLIALLCSVLGLAGLTVVRLERQQMQGSTGILDARQNARSGVELALLRITNDANWRTTYINGVETALESLRAGGAGTVSFILEDSDGSLTDADTNVRLKGVGRVGSIVQVSSVELTFGSALDCLEVAACANGLMIYSSSSTMTTNQKISSNSSVTANSGTIVNSDVEAVGSITGSGYNGTTTTPVPARTLPAASVFDDYIANGTVINFAAIPKVKGKRTITDVVLSPGNNPYGPTDPAGVYVIDCGGATIVIENARLIATLVLIDPSAGSILDEQINWEPAVANYPALLVQAASFNIATLDTPLDEAVRGVNFNPAGSPYQGSSDTDQTDTYPSLIKGIVYFSGDASITANHPQFDGVVVTGDELRVDSGESLTITYNPLFASDPPPGFGSALPSAIPGTWLWEAAP